MIFFTISLVQSVDAEELAIKGSNEDVQIFLAIEGESNMFGLYGKLGFSEITESKVKFYNSGGFSLKNVESGILVYGHPVTSTQYKIFVLTSDGPYRLLANIVNLNDYLITETIEPKSSLGADITKHDIPNIGRSGDESGARCPSSTTWNDTTGLCEIA